LLFHPFIKAFFSKPSRRDEFIMFSFLVVAIMCINQNTLTSLAVKSIISFSLFSVAKY
jgi:hypothetical protein